MNVNQKVILTVSWILRWGVTNLLHASQSWTLMGKAGQKAASAHSRSQRSLPVATLSCLFSHWLFGIKPTSSYTCNQLQTSGTGWLVSVLLLTAACPALRGTAVGSLLDPAWCACGSKKQPLFFLPSSQVSFPHELRAIYLAPQGNVFIGWKWGYACVFEFSREIVLGSWGWKHFGAIALKEWMCRKRQNWCNLASFWPVFEWTLLQTLLSYLEQLKTSREWVKNEAMWTLKGAMHKLIFWPSFIYWCGYFQWIPLSVSTVLQHIYQLALSS